MTKKRVPKRNVGMRGAIGPDGYGAAGDPSERVVSPGLRDIIYDGTHPAGPYERPADRTPVAPGTAWTGPDQYPFRPAAGPLRRDGDTRPGIATLRNAPGDGSGLSPRPPARGDHGLIPDDLHRLEQAGIIGDNGAVDVMDDPQNPGQLVIGSRDTVRRYAHGTYSERELARYNEVADSQRRVEGILPANGTENLVTSYEAARAVQVRTVWKADEVLDHRAGMARVFRARPRLLLDYLAFMMRDAQRQDGQRASRLYWPVDLRHELASLDQGAELALHVARGLAEGPTYQVTAGMVEEMRGLHEKIGLGIAHVDGSELPTPDGFAWLDRPWLLQVTGGYWMPVRALSWEKTVAPVGTAWEKAVTDGKREPGFSVDCARIALWALIADDIEFGRWDSRERAGRAANAIGHLQLVHTALLPFGERFALRPENAGQGESMLGLIHTLWMYLGMELSSSRQQGPGNPATARRVAKSLKHGTVHIVTLRKTRYLTEGPAGFRDVAWNWRWTVKDFYRHIDDYDPPVSPEGRAMHHQATPAARTGLGLGDGDHDVCAVCLASNQVVRIALVRGHIRGPSHLPLKPRSQERTVHRLSR